LDYRHENSFAYSEGEYPLSDGGEEDPHYRDDFDRRDAGGMQMQTNFGRIGRFQN